MKKHHSVQEKMYKLLIKASQDQKFKKKLLADPHHVFKTEGIDIDKKYNLKILENDDKNFHIVVPESLSSEMKLDILPKNPSFDEIFCWIATQILENTNLKEKLKSHPEEVLKHHGIATPKKMKLRIHQNTNKTHYFVIPQEINEELNEEELKKVAGGSHQQSRQIPKIVDGIYYGYYYQGKFTPSLFGPGPIRPGYMPGMTWSKTDGWHFEPGGVKGA